ncbi:hypothetical protein [Oenococcus oeni]|uniref:hypothetical protein n=1 Tax=Oenococcus oeni TaxID=1247 RepID=UPI000AD6A894|nr:hypothetical protein [Oenococcus oeni]
MKNKDLEDCDMLQQALTIETRLPAKKVLVFAATNMIAGFTFGFLIRSLFDFKKTIRF